MKNKKSKWERFAPEGVSAKREALWTALALLASAVWSLTFLWRLGRERAETEPQAAAGRVMSLLSFRGMLGTALAGFYLVALGMACLAMWHYTKIRKGEIKDPRDAHGRALAMPILGIAAAVAATTVVYFVYRGVFIGYREHLEAVYRAAVGLEG